MVNFDFDNLELGADFDSLDRSGLALPVRLYQYGRAENPKHLPTNKGNAQKLLVRYLQQSEIEEIRNVYVSLYVNMEVILPKGIL